VSRGQLTEAEVTQINSPVNVREETIVGEKSAEISQLILYSATYSQSLLMPLIVYILILLGSQTMINAVTAEKLDKTLETLLSAPVSRLTVLSAKMLAAAVVAILNAAVYMIGMNNMTSSVMSSVSGEYTEFISELGLTLTTRHYLLIVIQMLLSMLIALSVSMILGAFAKNVKSSQVLVMPILLITVVPFICSMFVDISSLPSAAKYLLYAIPFTHTFMATDCVIFGKTSLYVGGLIYQLIVLAVCMAIAIRIFTSDKIFTASESVSHFSFGFGRKKKKNSER
jgi:ABC-2 type transport system permease protein